MLEHVFRSSTNTPIPLLDERVRVLHEAGLILKTKFNSSVDALVQSAEGNAQRLIQIIVSNFPSYDDSRDVESYTSTFPQGTIETVPPSRLCFFKRAQILVADIWACFADSKHYNFSDVDTLTMFADYRVPQILAWLGAIRYSESLTEALGANNEWEPGSPLEMEIRACSIQAVELIRQSFEGHSPPRPQGTGPGRVPINSVLIDFALWDYAKAHKNELAKIPIHHVKSIFY